MADVLGAILAGGAGSRLGQPKATALLGGRPLAAYPLEALQEAGIEVVIVTRRDSPVPDIGAPIVFDTHQTRHPLSGILAALDHAQGRAVLAVATDLPFLNAAFLRQLADCEAPVVIPRADGRLHPLCARYDPVVTDALEQALAAESPLQSAVRALDPHIVEADPRLLTNINHPDDLARAEASLRPTPPPPSSRSGPRP